MNPADVNGLLEAVPLSALTPKTVSKSSELVCNISPPVHEKNFKRNSVLNELLKTESDYVRDLGVIDKVFREPLVSNQLLDKKDLHVMFSNFDVIYNVNSQLLSQLQKKIIPDQDHYNVIISDVFLKMGMFLKSYTAYVSNQDDALKICRLYRETNPAFAEFLRTCAQHKDVCGATLSSFLIKPVQRICRYPLLIKELIKHTPSVHPDYEGLGLALRKLEEVAEYVNAKKELLEAQNKMLEIFERISGIQLTELVTPTRTYVREGVFQLAKKPKNPKSTSSPHGFRLGVEVFEKPKEKYVFLFNDALIFAKIVGSQDKKEKKRMSSHSNTTSLTLSSNLNTSHNSLPSPSLSSPSSSSSLNASSPSTFSSSSSSTSLSLLSTNIISSSSSSSSSSPSTSSTSITPAFSNLSNSPDRKYQFKQKVFLNHVVASVPSYVSDSYVNGFLLNWLDNSEKYLLLAPSEKDRVNWVKDICSYGKLLHQQVVLHEKNVKKLLSN